MEVADLYLLLSDHDNKEQILDIIFQALNEYFEAERYYEEYNPITKKKEGNCETVNITQVLLQISDSLERIAKRLEWK